MAIESKSNKCSTFLIITLLLISSHAACFWWGAQNTITFKIESREGEVRIDEAPTPIEKTTEINEDIIDILTPNVIQDDTTN